MARYNNYAEAFKCLKANNENRALKEAQAIESESERKNQFLKDYYSIRENGEMNRRRHGQLMEICRNDALGTAIKGIFIGALEAGTLTDNGLFLAESMVDTWIKENGGASAILKENQNKTYLLNRIAAIVEDAAKEETEDIENNEDDEDLKGEGSDESKDDEKDKKVDDAFETLRNKIGDDKEANKALDLIQGKVEDDEDSDDSSKDDDDVDVDDELNLSDDEDSDDDEDSEDDDEDDDEKDDSSDSNDDAPEAPAVDDSSDEDASGEEESTDGEDDEDIPDDATTTSDDDETDVADDITDDIEDAPDQPLSVDGEPESNGKVLDELEKEEDVQKAVELIRQRVADAEENFIKRNAEDKKQVEELIGRISDNVKTVEDISDKEDPESKIAEESARMNRRKIKEITSNRPETVLEKMTRILMGNITKDTVLRESYLDENSQIDTGLVVESARVMYAFLETLNTLQLANVDANYITGVFESMK